ncbi:hypothetical protein FRC18_008735, partial [Serendipita sp. 400]
MQSPTSIITRDRPLSASEREAVARIQRNNIRHWKRPSVDEPLGGGGSSSQETPSSSSSPLLANLCHRPRSSDSSLSISSSNTNSSAFPSSLDPCNKPSNRSSFADLRAFTPTHPLSPLVRTHIDDCLAPEERCTCDPQSSPRSGSSTPLSAVAHSSSSLHAPTTTTAATSTGPGNGTGTTPITPTSPSLFDVQKRRRAHAFDHFASYSEMMPKPLPSSVPTPTPTPTNATSALVSQQQQQQQQQKRQQQQPSEESSAAPSSYRFPARSTGTNASGMREPRTQSWHVVQSVPDLHTTVSHEASSTTTSLTLDESRSLPPHHHHSHSHSRSNPRHSADDSGDEDGRSRRDRWDAGSSTTSLSMDVGGVFPMYRAVSHDGYDRRVRERQTTFDSDSKVGGEKLEKADFEFIKGLRSTYHDARHHHRHSHHHTHSHDTGFTNPISSPRRKSTKLWKR